MKNYNKLSVAAALIRNFGNTPFTRNDYDAYEKACWRTIGTQIPNIEAVKEWGWLKVVKVDRSFRYTLDNDGCVMIRDDCHHPVSSGMDVKTFELLSPVVRDKLEPCGHDYKRYTYVLDAERLNAFLDEERRRVAYESALLEVLAV